MTTLTPCLPRTAARLFDDERWQFGDDVDLAMATFERMAHAAANSLTSRIAVGQIAEDEIEHNHLTELRVSALSGFLFRAQRFRFRCRDRQSDFTLTGTLRHRAGNCLGLATLYCALAAELELPVAPLLFEGHIAAQLTSGGVSRHIELTRGGAVLPPRISELFYGRDTGQTLTTDEFRAVHLSNRGAFVHATANEHYEALAAFDEALELFPGYVGGRINRATLLVQMGRSEDAADELERILDLNPGPRYRRVAADLLMRVIVAGTKQFRRRGQR
jgi:tetratricopeptide (TPR) repeat protein